MALQVITGPWSGEDGASADSKANNPKLEKKILKYTTIANKLR